MENPCAYQRAYIWFSRLVIGLHFFPSRCAEPIAITRFKWHSYEQIGKVLKAEISSRPDRQQISAKVQCCRVG